VIAYKTKVPFGLGSSASGFAFSSIRRGQVLSPMWRHARPVPTSIGDAKVSTAGDGAHGAGLCIAS